MTYLKYNVESILVVFCLFITYYISQSSVIDEQNIFTDTTKTFDLNKVLHCNFYNELYRSSKSG